MGVRELYERTLTERGYRSDEAQLRAALAANEGSKGACLVERQA